MQWRKTKVQTEVLKIAEQCAIEACGVDKDYYEKYRLSRREEIVTIKLIVSHIAYYRVWIGSQFISDFLGKGRATVHYYIETCQNRLDTDKLFANIYQDAREMFNAKLAEMGDIY